MCERTVKFKHIWPWLIYNCTISHAKDRYDHTDHDSSSFIPETTHLYTSILFSANYDITIYTECPEQGFNVRGSRRFVVIVILC